MVKYNANPKTVTTARKEKKKKKIKIKIKNQCLDSGEQDCFAKSTEQQ